MLQFKKHVKQTGLRKANLQSTSLLQDLLQLAALLLGNSVISSTNEVAANKHAGYRAATCQLVQVILDGVTVLPLVELHDKSVVNVMSTRMS